MLIQEVMDPNQKSSSHSLNMKGMQFGRWIVQETFVKEFSYKNLKVKRTICKCVCDCGKKKDVLAFTLKNKRSQSCGCISGSLISDSNKKHGYSTRTIIHPLYKIWRGMVMRCNWPNRHEYENYGGRGIKIEFPNVESFIEYVEKNLGPKPTPRHSLDRINNNGNYAPGNLRWGSVLEQSLNKRKKSNASSNFRGVVWIKRNKNWGSRIRLNGVTKTLGYFYSEIDAAEAYLSAYYSNYGRFPPEYIPMEIKFKIP